MGACLSRATRKGIFASESSAFVYIAVVQTLWKRRRITVNMSKLSQ